MKPTWPPFQCFETPIWDNVGHQQGTWRHVERLYKINDIYNKSKNLESALTKQSANSCNLNDNGKSQSLASSSPMETVVIVSSWKKRKASTNGHLPTKANCFADSPYIECSLNLSTMATFFCPQGGRRKEVQLCYRNVFFLFFRLA